MNLLRYVIPITMCFCIALCNNDQEEDDNAKVFEPIMDTINELHGVEYFFPGVEYYEGAGDGHDDDENLAG